MDLSTITKLFQQKQPAVYPTQVTPQVNEDAKLQNETYIYYGTRICGKVTASHQALSAFLPRVYNAEKQRQIDDAELQQARKRELERELSEINNNISGVNAEIEKNNQRISDAEEAIANLKGKLIEAKDQHGEVNKMARVKMIVGLVILTLLTLYLFVFYSSTFYSAFFKEFNSEISVGAAMFDAQAIPHALANGFGELIFILCAPIIFMGLGYGLHFFMLQKSWTKYIKTGCVILITFIFDTILAYLIAKKIYDIEALTTLGDVPPFNIGMAISDANVWAVIFCGFIVYIIWGIVFDMTLTAYEDMRSNAKEILKIEEAIQAKKDVLSNEKQQLVTTKAELDKLISRRDALMTSISQNVHFDTQIIKVALSDFFSGWMAMMNALSKTQSEQDRANQIYTSTINQLFA